MKLHNVFIKGVRFERCGGLCFQAGIAIYTVGIGLSDKGEMETVASSPRNVFAVSDYRELESNVYSLRSEIRARESLPAASFPQVAFAHFCGSVLTVVPARSEHTSHCPQFP